MSESPRLLDDDVLHELASMDLLEEIRDIYARECDGVLTRLAETLAEGALDATRASAHKLKGMAAHCGAGALRTAAEQLEKAAARGDATAAGAAYATLTELERDTRRALVAWAPSERA